MNNLQQPMGSSCSSASAVQDKKKQDADAFMSDIADFTSRVKRGEALLYAQAFLTPKQKADADKAIAQQLETFETDVKKVADGTMTYSEMRSLYG